MKRWSDVPWQTWEYSIPLLAPATLVITQEIPLLAKGGMSNFVINSFIMNLIASVITWGFTAVRRARDVKKTLVLALLPVLAALIVKTLVPSLPD